MSDFDNQSVSLDSGTTVHFHDVGHSAVPLLLLHGMNAHSGSWRRNADYLARRMRVIAPSLPPTFELEEPLPIGAYVKILEEFLATLHVESVHLVGSSMGGWVALRYSLLHPQCIRSLVLEDAAGVAVHKTHSIELGTEDLHKIFAPTLVVWGELDEVITVDTAYILKSAIGGSRVVVIAGAAHVPHWERSSEFNAAVESFVGTHV